MATTQFHNDFVDRLLAEGEATGRAQMVLRVLSARGLQIPAEIRRRVLSCADSRQLETWVHRAATADSIDDVFRT